MQSMIQIQNLYFSCYYAYLLGDLEKTGMFYSLLREEFKIGHSLRKDQLLELKQIKTSLQSKTIVNTRQWVETSSLPPAQNPESNQNDLVRKIHYQGLEQLKTLLGDDIELYNLEHPCPPYGAIDMVYMGKETIYPVEVKKDIGGHDLIGQISKYDLYHRLQLHLGHYKYVQSVTVCNTYQPFVLDELKKLRIKPLFYSLQGDGINLYQ